MGPTLEGGSAITAGADDPPTTLASDRFVAALADEWRHRR